MSRIPGLDDDIDYQSMGIRNMPYQYDQQSYINLSGGAIECGVSCPDVDQRVSLSDTFDMQMVPEGDAGILEW